MDHVERSVPAEPGVAQDLPDRGPLFEVLFQHAGDELLGLGGAGVPDGVGEVEGLVEYLVDDGVVLLADEGRVAGEEDEEEDAQRPDVALAVVEAVDDLRGNVVDLRSPSPTVPVQRRSLGWPSSKRSAEPKSMSLRELNCSL